MSQPLVNTSGTPSANKTADDIFAELSKDDDQDTLDLTTPIKDKDDKKKDDKSDKDDKLETTDDVKDETDNDDKDNEDDEEIDELSEIEEDLKEIDEEKLELTTPVRRREILKKYPNLFKDFPYLEKAYYREQQFTEILSTIDDAKAAAESHQVLQRYTEDMVEKGNIGNVLKMIKDSNPDTYAQVVDNYMDHLHNLDPTAALHVQSNMVKHIIVGMVEEAKSSGDDDLRTAALLLNKYAFGSSKFVPPQRMSKAANPEDKTKADAQTAREKEFQEKQIGVATNEVNTRVNNAIRSAIENNIDPKGEMTDYVKRAASKDALAKVSSLLEKDVRFQKIVEKLWEKAAKANYSSDSLTEIRKAFLSRGKSLLAPVLKSARNEALKGIGRRVKEEKDNEDETPEPQTRERAKSSERSRSSGNTDKAKLDTLKGKTSYEALQAMMGD